MAGHDELLLNTAAGRTIADRIADPALSLHVPRLADIEVTQIFRRYVKDGDIEAADAAMALENLRSLDLERHAHELKGSMWETTFSNPMPPFAKCREGGRSQALCQKANDTARPFTREENHGTTIRLAGEAS